MYPYYIWNDSPRIGFGARTIAIIDTVVDSPLGQVSMIPMLAWIAKEAFKHRKATYFSVMAAFTNLALSASHLGTRYLNDIFEVERGHYGELGMLMITVALLGLVLPTMTVLLLKPTNNQDRITKSWWKIFTPTSLCQKDSRKNLSNLSKTASVRTMRVMKKLEKNATFNTFHSLPIGYSTSIWIDPLTFPHCGITSIITLFVVSFQPAKILSNIQRMIHGYRIQLERIPF